MFVGATGLLVAAFISPEKLGRMATVSTQATCTMVQHGLKVIVFGALGFVLGMVAPHSYHGINWVYRNIHRKIYSTQNTGPIVWDAI